MKRTFVFVVLFAMLGLQLAFAQTKQITGTVTSADDGLGIPGVSVIIKGTTVGTTTDIDGKYSLSVPGSDAIIVYSFIGLKTVEMPATQSVINVVMQSDSQELDEVVVVGYGVVKKSELTGSVASVKPEELTGKPVASVAQALQGKVAGVQVVSTSGRSGDMTEISIRGNGSLSASNSVLYVIDGVPQTSMGSISPNDIESVEVLKDAASAAIYGSRASNGVVLIQTKRGKYSAKSTIDVVSSLGIQTLVKKPTLLNASQYKRVHDVARENFISDIAAGIVGPPKDPNVLTPMAESPYDTDWIDLVTRDFAKVQSHQVSFGGGNEDTRFYLSGSIFDQQGIIKMDQYRKYRTRANVDHKFNKYVKIGVQSYFSVSESVPMADDNNMYQPWSAAHNAHPNVSPTDDNGKLTRGSFVNPLMAFERQITDKWQELGGSFYFDVTPISGLVWHSAYSGDVAVNRYNRFDAPNTKRGENGGGAPTGHGYYSTENNRSFQIENTITYSGNLFEQKLRYSILGGHSFQKSLFEDSYVAGENFPSNDLSWLTSAGLINMGRSYTYSTALESYFSRVQLSWNERYMLMFSIRGDGSSKFNKDNRWGFFPAASIGWNVSKEDFFQSSLISNLKLRASYGLTGNQSGISYATGLNLLGSGSDFNHNGNPGLGTTDLYNPDLHWEKGYSMNAGFDLGMFNNRLNLIVDVYSKTSKDLLYRTNVPQESGYPTMMSNDGGEISNKGIEVTADFSIIKTKELSWSINANFSYNHNEVVKLGAANGYYVTSFASVVMEGESLGSFYFPEAIGVASKPYEYKDKDGNVVSTVQPGDMIYADLNGDGLIDDKDRKVFSGAIAPIYGGFGTRVAYKGFDLAIISQYSIGKKVYAMYKEDALNGGAVGSPSFGNNMIDDMLDYWTPTNTNAANPRPHLSSEISAWNLKRSSRFLEDADYLRVSEITLGYTFTSNLKLPYVKNCRLYVQARNPFTFTKYKGLDPEVQYIDPDREDNKVSAGYDNNGIPNMKTFSVGLNLNF
ncbi:MAG: TonB-dependent receptor [Bacteroidales bacterium]|nr:TonB-dependent receptor [Bacteroidales bacterium]MBN2750221.1 TonB-dependent receptor [Bacteroidales bacterium]